MTDAPIRFGTYPVEASPEFSQVLSALSLHPAAPELVAFGLGELDRQPATDVKGHLESCQQCRDLLAVVSDDLLPAEPEHEVMVRVPMAVSLGAMGLSAAAGLLVIALSFGPTIASEPVQSTPADAAATSLSASALSSMDFEDGTLGEWAPLASVSEDAFQNPN